ncbi:MAG TPA: hypothetical protein VGF02_13720 [Pseudolabrys sp.]|jgi:hypothetical protein
MRIKHRIAGISLFVLLSALPADAVNEIQPGLWQDSEITAVNGKAEAPKVTTNCVTPQDAQDPVKMIRDGMKDQA